MGERERDSAASWTADEGLAQPGTPPDGQTAGRSTSTCRCVSRLKRAPPNAKCACARGGPWLISSSSCTSTKSRPPLAPIILSRVHSPDWSLQSHCYYSGAELPPQPYIFIFLLLKRLQENVAQTKIRHGHIPFASHLLCTCGNSFSNILGTPGKD